MGDLAAAILEKYNRLHRPANAQRRSRQKSREYEVGEGASDTAKVVFETQGFQN